MHVDQYQNLIIISHPTKLVGKTGTITISHNLLKPDITGDYRGYHFMRQQ